MYFHIGDPLREAKKILGETNVITCKQMKQALGVRWGFSPRLQYSLRTLEQCAEQNTRGEMWRLVCRINQPLVTLVQKRKEEFYPSVIWEKPQPWMKVGVESAYRLINLVPKSYNHRTLFVRKPKVDRAWVTTVVQTLVAFKRIHQQRFMEKDFHAADEERGIIPVVGGYDDEGILLYTIFSPEPISRMPDSLMTLVCRIPEKKVK